MNLPRIAHPFVVVLVFALVATGIWASGESDQPAAAMEKEMVLDPSTGEMVEAPQYGGTITFGRATIGQHPDAWDIGGFAAQFTSVVLEKLVIGDWAIDRSVFNFRTYGQSFSIMRGALAESWETPDPTTIIAHIRQGVHWHDKAPMNGRELTASDVEFNYHRLYGLGSGFTEASPAPEAAGKKGNLESITATDKWTVVFKLKQPDVFALDNLLDPWEAFMYPPEVIKQHGDVKDWRNLVGTGPMELTEYVDDASVKWTRAPNYWGFDEKFPQNRLPYVDEINAVIIPDMAARLAALRSGKIDVLGTIGHTQLRSIDQVQSLRQTNPEINIWGFDFRGDNSFSPNNINNPPFNDIRVRRAMQMALDLETINETFFDGLSDPTPNGLIANSNAGIGTPFEEWPEEVKQYYRYDPEGAKRLLAEAGYPDGFKTRMDFSAHADLNYAELAANYWREIGVEVEVHSTDPTQANVILRENSSDGLLWWFNGVTYSGLGTLQYYTTDYLRKVNPPGASDPGL